MKVKRMGITEILRRIWIFSANKIKSLTLLVNNQLNSTHCPTQLIIAANNYHTGGSFGIIFSCLNNLALTLKTCLSVPAESILLLVKQNICQTVEEKCYSDSFLQTSPQAGPFSTLFPASDISMYLLKIKMIPQEIFQSIVHHLEKKYDSSNVIG